MWFNKYTLLAAIALLISGVGYALYAQYQHMSSQLKVQEKQNAELQIALASNNAILTSMESAVHEWADSQDKFGKEILKMHESTKAYQKEVNALHDLFKAHDLSRLAFKKPGLIERRVNDSTRDVMLLLECSSGSGDKSCSASRKTESVPGNP